MAESYFLRSLHEPDGSPPTRCAKTVKCHQASGSFMSLHLGLLLITDD
jgi:hypothetical protein